MSASTTSPKDLELLAPMQRRLEEIIATKEANATKGKKLDEQLRLAFKNPPKRPNISEERIAEEMDKLELRRSTTSMSLNDEKYILRELQLLKDKKTQVREYESFQQTIDTMRKERNDLFQLNKSLEEQIQQLQSAIKKVTLAEKLKCSATDFVSIEVQVPEDRMGSVIGRGFTKVQQIEQECGVLVDIDNKNNIVRVTSTPANTLLAKEMIENITLATSQSIGLHPDTLRMLLFQKTKNLQELEQTLGLKIDINKADGVLTSFASPMKIKQLEKAIKELVEGKAEMALPAEIVPKLIGKKGETINQLMEDTGASVDIDKVCNTVRICGPKESVEMAKKFILQLIEDQKQREQEFCVSDRRIFSEEYEQFKFDFFAEFLMANKAAQLKLLRTDASEARIKVVKNQKKLHVIGNKAQLYAMEEALRERIREFENHTWLVEVEPHVLSLIIGKKGSRIRQIEEESSGIVKASEDATSTEQPDEEDDEDAGDDTPVVVEKPGKRSHTKQLPVRIDIQGNYVCVFGETSSQVEKAKKTIKDIIANNQRSFLFTSPHCIAILVNNKRAKLNEIETATGCKIQLPPSQHTGGANNSNPTGTKKRLLAEDESAQVKITLTGTAEAVSTAKTQLEEVADAHHVRYIPLDNDEVPTIIGRKGETITQLEEKTGAKLRVLQSGGAGAAGTDAAQDSERVSELEVIGTEEQLESVSAALDELLQTQNRELLQLDAFATGCLIGKKGERIKTIRAAHPEATIDAFPTRGQVRIKAPNQEVLKECVDFVLKTLRETPVIESVKVPENKMNFHTLLKDPSVALRLSELEAEGGSGMKVSFVDDGKTAKIRGPALGIGKLKRFLDMLVSPDGHFMEQIKLPSFVFTGVLTEQSKAKDQQPSSPKAATPSASLKLNENGQRICRQTNCELRVRKHDANKQFIRIAGSSPKRVFEAKSAVEKVLQFYFPDCFATLEDVSLSAIAHMYECLPLLNAKYNACFSLASTKSLKVFTDSKANTKAVVDALHKELKNWSKLHIEVPISAWLVPILVGKNGETIRKLSTDTTARLELAPANTASPQSDRTLSISGASEEIVANAKEKVLELVAAHEAKTVVTKVPKELVDLVLTMLRKEPSSSNVGIHVLDDEESIKLYSGNTEEREKLQAKLEEVLASAVVEKVLLPAADGPAHGTVVGALIGKSGANIRALQKEFPNIVIDIRREDNHVTLKGPCDEVTAVKSIMEDKVKELVAQQIQFQQRRHASYETNAATSASSSAKKSNATSNAEHHGAEGKENNDGNVAPFEEPTAPTSLPGKPSAPVGGTPSLAKLTKNQRRRMRKRAENEKKSDVLSMLVAGDLPPIPSANLATAAAPSRSIPGKTPQPLQAQQQQQQQQDMSGYYHSSSGYSLRL